MVASHYWPILQLRKSSHFFRRTEKHHGEENSQWLCCLSSCHVLPWGSGWIGWWFRKPIGHSWRNGGRNQSLRKPAGPHCCLQGPQLLGSLRVVFCGSLSGPGYQTWSCSVAGEAATPDCGPGLENWSEYLITWLWKSSSPTGRYGPVVSKSLAGQYQCKSRWMFQWFRRYCVFKRATLGN